MLAAWFSNRSSRRLLWSKWRASMGYRRAGFAVVGVDINPQRELSRLWLLSSTTCAVGLLMPVVHCGADVLDVIHASPPCQAYSDLHHRTGREYPDLIERVRELLEATGKPYVIENVPDVRDELRDPTTLCGAMFPPSACPAPSGSFEQRAARPPEHPAHRTRLHPRQAQGPLRHAEPGRELRAGHWRR